MNSWYLLETTPSGEQPAGPFDIEQLAAMVPSGRLTPTTRVARAGASAWMPASQDPELSALFARAAGSPAAPPVRASVASAYAPQTYTIAAAFELGWRAMTANWGRLVVCTLIFVAGWAVVSAPGVVAQLLFIGAEGQRGGADAAFGVAGLGLSCCGWLLQVFVGVPFFASFYYCGVRAVRGELQVMDVFAGFRRYWPVLGVYVLSALMSAGIGIVCFVPFIIGIVISVASNNPVAAIIAGALSMIILIVAMCFLLVLLTMPTLLVVDPKMRAEWCPGAFSIAWQMGKNGNSPSFLLLAVCGGLLLMVCVVALVVPAILFGAPLVMTLIGAAYELMAAPVMANTNDHRRVRAAA